MFLSHRDCVAAHIRALEVETKYMLAYVEPVPVVETIDF